MTTAPRFRRNHLAATRKAAFGARMRPVPDAGGMSAEDGLQTLRDAPTAVRQFLEGHRDALAEAHRSAAQDTNLSAEGQAARHAELRQQAQDHAAATAAQLRTSVDQAAAAVHARAAATRPKAASGVEPMMGRQVAWNRTREMLDGGVPLDELIGETTDAETLHSMRDELPAYLRTRDYAPTAREEVVRAIDDQLAHVAGGRALDAHNASREAEQHMAQLGPLLDHVDQVAAGRARPEHGMVAAKRAEHASREHGPAVRRSDH